MDDIKEILNQLKKNMFFNKNRIDDFYLSEVDYFEWDNSQIGTKTNLCCGIGKLDGHYQISFQYPEQKAIKNNKNRPCIWVKTTDTDIWNVNNPQFIVYYNDEVVRALDINHHFFELPEKKDDKLFLNVYTNTNKPDVFLEVWSCYKNVDMFTLYYRLKAIYESYLIIQDGEISKIIYDNFLKKIKSVFFNRENLEQSIQDCLTIVEKWLIEQDVINQTNVLEHIIGHTHIDISWLWTLEQTKEKVVRSFSNAVYLMERYPEMTFMSSTPLLYEFLECQDVNLYEKVNTYIKENRWFVEGGMYVESDINLPSGESLIRQIYYGKKFFRDTFGKESEILWLPDCFGFSGSLPQIMKKSELNYFFTSKMDWNDTNKLPNDTFYWKGIDGSEVLSYFLTTSDYSQEEVVGTTYNGRLNASQVKGAWKRFCNKELSKDILQIYGFGDGGGGPTEEMLEYSYVFSHQLPNMPKVIHSNPEKFFSSLDSNLQEKKVPKWQGELYLETHRGVYTTDGLLKKLNRQSENLLLIAEWTNTLCKLINLENVKYSDELEQAWKQVLINQFHDILPGTSIKSVHDEAVARYHLVEKLCKQTISENLKVIGLERNDDISIYQEHDLIIGNPTSFSRSEVLSDDKYDYLVENIVPYAFKQYSVKNRFSNRIRYQKYAIGQSTYVTEQFFGEYTVETKFYRFKLNENGNITDFYDKTLHRYLTGKYGFNRFQLFVDDPEEFDAWNLDYNHLSKGISIDNTCQLVEIIESEYKLEIHYHRSFGESTIYQIITLYNHSKRIDFKTKVDWKERHKCLKVCFDSTLINPKAVYNIQFGNIERSNSQNTSWDNAKFEVCGHKWADLSEEAWGISLLNDCKYGYSSTDSSISLTLLRSSQYPAENIDKGIHEFTYSLLPHSKTCHNTIINKEAYSLNNPLILTKKLEDTVDIFDIQPIKISKDNIICECLKVAYDENAYIIRCYESSGLRTHCEIYINKQAKSVDSVNLLENKLDESIYFDSLTGQLSIEFKPFEIRTFKIYM